MLICEKCYKSALILKQYTVECFLYIMIKNMSQFLAGNPYVLWQIWLHPFNITQVTRMDGRYFQTQIVFKVEEVSKCLLKLARQVHNLHFCVSPATQREML